MSDQLWFKDAVIYEAHVRAFLDSSGDGVGDFPGLISKLYYIADLGVNAIWLLPFYPSPRLDDGYDISDYRSVHPEYGTMADFDAKSGDCSMALDWLAVAAHHRELTREYLNKRSAWEASVGMG